jgi:serine/threonine protein kinase
MTGGAQGGNITIDGRFELLQRLGGGGMGLVWRARDLMLQREVALKEVRSPDPAVYGADPGEAHVVRERVLREAQALARLQHPNVVTIHHIVDSPELAHPWLVMELVTGGSLDGRLDRGPLTVPEAVRIARGVLGALRAAHAAGIQHRDVKPANVLMREDGTPVLTDFGIAALEASPGLTATGMLIGSPEYMAPERIHGREGDPASDLWSLGLMLYVGLEGRNPLRRDSTIATIAAVAEAKVPPPVRSGALAPVLSALLVKEPERRPGAGQLDAMLAQVESGNAADTGGFAYTRQFADRTPADAGTGPVANPYDQHTIQTKRRTRVGAYTVSGVAALATCLTMVYLVHHAAKAANHTANQHGGGLSHSSTTADSPLVPAVNESSQPADSRPTDDQPSQSGKTLLTPDGVRGVIAKVLKVSGGTRIVAMTVYPDHASFDVVKKDDPTVFDTYLYSDGKAKFSRKGEALDKGEPALDPTAINWDALPALIKDGTASLGVKKPTLTYVIVDSDIISHVPEMRFYVTDDYRGAYIAADLKGKVTRREPAS